MTTTTHPAAPMAAYVSLNTHGDALLRFANFGLGSTSEARLLATKGWIEPDFVRITTADDRQRLFEFASLTLPGSIIWNELTSWLTEGDFEWGATWNVRDRVIGRHAPIDEPKMVHTRGLVGLMDEANIDVLYDQCANGWWQGDATSFDTEDITLQQQ